jgi:5-methylcytosine-specific restriction endonuclease McrA
VNFLRPKRARLRLDSRLYEQLRSDVLRRDGWRCQVCGAMSNLEVHHREFRSQSGDDSEQNLITLCITCHSDIHRMTDKPEINHN